MMRRIQPDDVRGVKKADSFPVSKTNSLRLLGTTYIDNRTLLVVLMLSNITRQERSVLTC
jgi:hypothetical protein